MSDDTAAEAENTLRRRRPSPLGRGLGALLGESRREEPVGAHAGSAPQANGARGREALATLPVADIDPNPRQPRRRFDEAALTELSQSIAERGVIQPIIVRPTGDGRYQLVAGERRWRAAQMAQVHEIPAIIRDLSDHDVKVLALVENLQREDLNPAEEARAYRHLADDQGFTQADIAQMVAKSRSHVANLLRLLQLPESVLDLLEDGQLSMGHARALIGAADAAEIAHKVASAGLSVRDVERLVRQRGRSADKGRGKRAARDAAQDADIAAVQTHLEELLGLKVEIATDADPRSGAVTIRYRTLDQLDLICQRLTGGGV